MDCKQGQHIHPNAQFMNGLKRKEGGAFVALKEQSNTKFMENVNNRCK